MIEVSCGKQEGATTARRQLPVFPPLRMLEEFFVGMGVDTNMGEMMEYFADNQEAPVDGTSIWEALSTTPETDLKKFFKD